MHEKAPSGTAIPTERKEKMNTVIISQEMEEIK